MDKKRLEASSELFTELLEEFENNLDFKVDPESKENTPDRLASMFTNELLQGYSQNPEEILSKTFDTTNDDMVIVGDIPFVSLCSHHWLPFIGKAYVGYIPDKKVVGLSKIPRLVQCYARRFQIQENMTAEIATALFDILKCKGCIVITKAEHLCAQIRGVQSHGTYMSCSAIRGAFDDQKIRQEFLELVQIKG